MKSWRIYGCIVGLAVSLLAVAAPARRSGRSTLLPNGDSMTVYTHGDEFFHWETDAKGNWIERQKDGSYLQVPALSESEIRARRMASPAWREAQAHRTAAAVMPQRGVIILVSFSNLDFTTNTDSLKLALTQHGFTNDRGAVGSASDYFALCSNGRYTPEFDVWGPYKLSQTYSHYAGSTGMANGPAMAREACDSAVVDGKSFAPYTTSAKTVPFVFILYAGKDWAMGNPGYVWAHQYYINSSHGGYTIQKYACSSEIGGNPTDGLYPNGIGTFCHEFSHILGLPDYYVTGNDASSNPNYDYTNGMWNLMDYGCYNNGGWTPCLYSAYDRYFMGWETPQLLNAAYNDTVPVTGSVTGGSTRVITAGGTMPSSTYRDWAWYIENRQQTGWDAYLPGHGLIVTKVQYNSSSWGGNIVNNNSPMLYDIQEAGGKLDYFGSPSDPFPGTYKVRTYTPTGSYTLSEITEQPDGKVTYKFMGGVTGLTEEQVEGKKAKVVLKDGIVVIQRDNSYYTLTGQQICK